MTTPKDPKSTAISAVVAAASLRSESVLWRSLETAIAAGVTTAELEEAIRIAAQVASDAVRDDGMRILREVRLHAETQARWS